MRGEADRAALRIRHHDDGVHRRFAPTGEVAGLVYDSLEELRVEALGSERMAGVRANLAAAYRARVELSRSRGERGQDATVAEIVDLYAREQLLGFQLTEAQQKLLGGLARVAGRAAWPRELGRRWRGSSSPTRSSSPAGCASMLAHLGLSEQLDEQPDDGESEDQGEERAAAGPGRGGRRARRRRRGRGQQTTSRLEQDAQAASRVPRSEAAARDSAEEVESEPGGEDERRGDRAATGRSSSRPAASRWPTRCSRPSSTRW